MTDFNIDLAANGLEIAAERLSTSLDVHTEDIAEIVQTKMDGSILAVDNAIVRFDGTDGITVQASGAKVDDNNNMTVPGTIATQAGGTAGWAMVGGIIVDHYIDVGNSGTAETDLYSDTVTGNSFNSNGDKLRAEYGGTFVLSATATRRIKLYFAGTAIFDSGALAITIASSWTVDATIARVSASVIRYKIGLATQGAAVTGYTSVGELTGLTLSNDNILKITGTSAGIGAASNDIVAKIGTVFWHPGVS